MTKIKWYLRGLRLVIPLLRAAASDDPEAMARVSADIDAFQQERPRS